MPKERLKEERVAKGRKEGVKKKRKRNDLFLFVCLFVCLVGWLVVVVFFFSVDIFTFNVSGHFNKHSDYIYIEREYNKFQACLGFENIYSKFSPMSGIFQGL